MKIMLNQKKKLMTNLFERIEKIKQQKTVTFFNNKIS